MLVERHTSSFRQEAGGCDNIPKARCFSGGGEKIANLQEYVSYSAAMLKFRHTWGITLIL